MSTATDQFAALLGGRRGSADAQTQRDRAEQREESKHEREEARVREIRERVVGACEAAAADHHEAAVYLRDLADAFINEQGGCVESQEPVLRLERWWDTGMFGPFICTPVSLEEAQGMVADPDELKAALAGKGFYDCSDATQPMAQLFVVLSELSLG